MKRLVIAMLLLCAPAWAAPAFVQGKTACSDSASTLTATLTSTGTTGNTLLVGVTYNSVNNVLTSVQDNNATNLTQDSHAIITAPPANDNSSLYYYRYTNIPGTVTAITATLSGALGLCVSVIEVSGLHATPLDAADNVGAQSNFDTTWETLSFTPTASTNEIIIGFAWANFERMSGSGSWTTGTQDPNTTTIHASTVYQIVTSTTGSYQPAGTTAGSAVPTAIYGAYKAAAAGGTGGALITGTAKLTGAAVVK